MQYKTMVVPLLVLLMLFAQACAKLDESLDDVPGRYVPTLESSPTPLPTATAILTKTEAVWLVAPKVLKLIDEAGGDGDKAKLNLNAANICFESGRWKVTLHTFSGRTIPFSKPDAVLLPGTWILFEPQLEVRPHDENAWQIWARAQGDRTKVWENMQGSKPPNGTPCDKEIVASTEFPQQDNR